LFTTKLCIGSSFSPQFFRIADFYKLQLLATDVITVVY